MRWNCHAYVVCRLPISITPSARPRRVFYSTTNAVIVWLPYLKFKICLVSRRHAMGYINAVGAHLASHSFYVPHGSASFSISQKFSTPGFELHTGIYIFLRRHLSPCALHVFLFSMLLQFEFLVLFHHSQAHGFHFGFGTR